MKDNPAFLKFGKFTLLQYRKKKIMNWDVCIFGILQIVNTKIDILNFFGNSGFPLRYQGKAGANFKHFEIC